MNKQQLFLNLNTKEKLNSIQKHTIKENIFYLLHILMKYPENEIWIQIIIILIEMIQLLAFSFSLIVMSMF